MGAGRVFILVFASLIMAFAGTIAAYDQPTWISLDGSAIGEKPSAVVQRSNDLETVIEFQLRGMLVDEIVGNGESFQSLRFPYYHTTLEVGKPQLPVITEMIGVPGSARVRVSVIDSVVVTLKDYKVYPFQTPLLEGEERVKFDIDKDLYAQNVFYPERVVETGKPSIWRDVRVVNLRVYPVRFNPATGELKVYEKLTVKLEYYGTSDINVLTPSEVPVSPRHEGMYRRLIPNFDYLDLPKRERGSIGETGTAQDYDYLIIAVDRFVDELGTLEVWKNAQGITTQIIALSAIGGGGSASDIKEYIEQEYNDHHIKWVLLVGDIDELPIYTGYPGIVSDYWYALLTGDDLLPEIAVGRLSTTVEAEVDNMVSKSISYEGTPSGGWMDNALLVAHRQGAPGKYEGCKENIRLATSTQSHTYRVKYPSFSSAYGAAGTTNQNVIDAIDAGQGVVNYRGHGGSDCWWSWNTGGESFTTADVAALDNADKTPVIFSIACYNNRLDVADDCLGEAFTKADNAAVAFLGASRPSYTTANHTYDEQLFATIFDEGTQNIGNASNIAAMRIMQEHGSYGEKNAKMYLWLGDPSLAIPMEPDPTAYYWLVLIDTTGSMAGDRIERAKNWAIQKVSAALADSNDMVALATYAGSSPFTLKMDWTRDEEALISRIEGLLVGGMTPLADACCTAADKLISDVPDTNARRLILLTDGDENYSTGECSGPLDSDPNPPWCDNVDSWNCKVWTKLVGNLIIDVGYFGNLGPTRAGPEAIVDISSDGQHELFLQDLADTTGGTYHDPQVICGNGILEPGEQCEVGYPCSGSDYDGVAYECINCQCVPGGAMVAEYGDAPDPGFPSYLASNGPRHLDTTDCWVGWMSTTESDALVPDLDLDDAPVLIFASPTGSAAGSLWTGWVYFPITIASIAPGPGVQPRYLNVLLDCNSSGDWCNGGGNAGEWVVRNYLLPAVHQPGMTVYYCLGGFSWVQFYDDLHWLRITLSGTAVNPTYGPPPPCCWDGSVLFDFQIGETEDWSLGWFYDPWDTVGVPGDPPPFRPDHPPLPEPIPECNKTGTIYQAPPPTHYGQSGNFGVCVKNTSPNHPMHIVQGPYVTDLRTTPGDDIDIEIESLECTVLVPGQTVCAASSWSFSSPPPGGAWCDFEVVVDPQGQMVIIGNLGDYEHPDDCDQPSGGMFCWSGVPLLPSLTGTGLLVLLLALGLISVYFIARRRKIGARS